MEESIGYITSQLVEEAVWRPRKLLHSFLRQDVRHATNSFMTKTDVSIKMLFHDF